MEESNRRKEERLFVLFALILYSILLLTVSKLGLMTLLIFLPYPLVSFLYLYMKRYFGFFLLVSMVLILTSVLFAFAILPYILSEGEKVPLTPYFLALISSYLLFVLTIREIRGREIIKEPVLPYFLLNLMLFILFISSIFITVKICDYSLFSLLGDFLLSLPFLILASALIFSRSPECSTERVAGFSLIPIFWGLFVLTGGPLFYFMVAPLCCCIIFPIFLFFYMFGNLWIGFTFFLAYVIKKHTKA